jgi:phosphate-selective porin OprO and OprP
MHGSGMDVGVFFGGHSMKLGAWSKLTVAAAALVMLAGGATRADDTQADPNNQDVNAQINDLKRQIAELKAQQNDNWLTKERESQIRSIVEDVLADAKKRSQAADGETVGYKDGFYLQTPDQNYKLLINGVVQVRYDFVYRHDANTNDSLHPITATNNEENTSGFDVRRARLKFSGNVFSPNIIYQFYADFFGSSTGAFTVLEAFAGYNFNDSFKIKAGAVQMPFTRASGDPDAKLLLMARPEVFTAMMGNDTTRAMGVSVYGEPIKDRLNYEFQVNNGVNSNTLRRPDTTDTGTTNAVNLDNRLGFYTRLNFVGNGKLKDFSDQPDLRTGNRDFIWLAGMAVGYESQNANTSANGHALPAPQNSAVMAIGNRGAPGFTTYTLNGDVYRATLDFTAKYQGWSFQAAGLFQQINANQGATEPFKQSLFESGYYAQLGYMLIPNKFELTGRVQYLLTEGSPNIGEYYALGANYYLAGHNAKIQTDVTYTPESVYTDAGETQLQNTHQLSFRVQFQVMF